MKVMDRKKTKRIDVAKAPAFPTSIDAARPIELPKPRVTSFVARDCTQCTALRDQDATAKGKSFTRVYGTVGRVRYCRCEFCGNTWKQTDIQ